MIDELSEMYVTPGGLYHDDVVEGPKKVWGILGHEKAHRITGKKLVGNITLDWNLVRPTRLPFEN